MNKDILKWLIAIVLFKFLAAKEWWSFMVSLSYWHSGKGSRVWVALPPEYIWWDSSNLIRLFCFQNPSYAIMIILLQTNPNPTILPPHLVKKSAKWEQILQCNQSVKRWYWNKYWLLEDIDKVSFHAVLSYIITRIQSLNTVGNAVNTGSQ